MTLGDPNCRNCLQFLLIIRAAQFLQNLRSDFHPICRDWQRIFLFNPTIFLSQWPMCNKLCAFIHDALDRLSVIHEVDRLRVMLTTPIHCVTDIDPLRTDIFPWTFPLSNISPTLACDGMWQEVRVLRWPINTNKQASKGDNWVGYVTKPNLASSSRRSLCASRQWWADELRCSGRCPPRGFADHVIRIVRVRRCDYHRHHHHRCCVPQRWRWGPVYIWILLLFLLSDFWNWVFS